MKSIFETKVRLGFKDFYYVIVPNIASGRKKRYTIYRLPSDGGYAKIIGRELPLGFCRKLIANQ